MGTGPKKGALRVEAEIISRLSAAGWNVANVTAGGQPGGSPRQWTLERLKEAAAEVSTRGELLKKNRKAYDAAASYGLMDAIFGEHSNQGFRADIARDYTDADLKAIADHCGSSAKMRKQRAGAWLAAYRRGLLRELFPAMKPRKRRVAADAARQPPSDQGPSLP